MGPHHPHQRISTSPFTYDPHFIENYRHLSNRDFQPVPREVGAVTSVKIGNDVWIGENVVFAKDVTVGDGAVIAGHSVVVGDVAAYTIVGGNPARHIRYRFDTDLINELQELQWWQYNFLDFGQLNLTNPKEFSSELKGLITSGDIQPFLPHRLNAFSFQPAR